MEVEENYMGARHQTNCHLQQGSQPNQRSSLRQPTRDPNMSAKFGPISKRRGDFPNYQQW